MYSLNITGATPEELYVNSLNMLADFVRRSQPAVVETPAGDAAAVSDVVEQEVIPPKKSAAKKEKFVADEMPDLAGGAKALTMDGDIRPRLRAIQEAHAARDHSMEECVAYLLKLYEPFGIKNAKLLKPEQFADFMKASEAYLDGSAK